MWRMHGEHGEYRFSALGLARATGVILLLWACLAHALDWRASPGVGRLFEAVGARGTFVLYDLAEDRFTGHDRVRAETRYTPASTFKIAHTLIGLSVGAVSSVDEVLPFGGQPQPFPAWEHDMGLRDAIRVSNVPVYQALARRIGLARMATNVVRLDYGNGEIGQAVDRFWLDGPLAISAVEQTRFLARLLRDELPFPKEYQAATRDIVPSEQGDGWLLASKTGWAMASNPNVGWWVGWVRKGERLYTFALNMDMPQISEAAKRAEIGKAALRTLGVFPVEP